LSSVGKIFFLMLLFSTSAFLCTMKTPFPTPTNINIMSSSPRRPQAGFTLIELLTVVAIIGILAGIIFPTVGAVQINIKRNVDGTNLRSIGQAALAFGQDNSDGSLPDPMSTVGQAMGGAGIHKWIGLLARNGLNDPKLYFSKVDLNYPATLDGIMTIVNPDNKKQLDPSFISKNVPAFCFVGGLRTLDPTTVPIGYTRGLTKGGEWKIGQAPYNDWGGFIVFMGGNLEKYKAIDDKLTNTRGKATSNLAECVPTANANAKIYGLNDSIAAADGAKPDTAR
jgi:prepilin-type N-terminal cleavage/methylation domain-containing protein